MVQEAVAEDLHDLLEVEEREGRLQQVVCFRAEDEAGDWFWRREGGERV